MKKVETIIKEIDRLERELYTNYNPKQIKETIEKCEKEHTISSNGCDLITVLYEGAINELDNPLAYKEVK